MAVVSSTLTWSVAREAGASTPPSSVSDQVLIRQFLATGDGSFFEVLVQRYRNNVFRLAVSMLGPGTESAAEDLTQEVFGLVYRKLDTFRGDCAFATWLYQLTRNRTIDRRRRAAFNEPLAGDEVLQRLPDKGAHSNPLRTVAARERQARVLEKVSGLGEPQRSVVLLHYWLDRTIAEVAELLDLRPGTVKSHLHRARHKLARVLREEDRDD